MTSCPLASRTDLRMARMVVLSSITRIFLDMKRIGDFLHFQPPPTAFMLDDLLGERRARVGTRSLNHQLTLEPLLSEPRELKSPNAHKDLELLSRRNDR